MYTFDWVKAAEMINKNSRTLISAWLIVVEHKILIYRNKRIVFVKIPTPFLFSKNREFYFGYKCDADPEDMMNKITFTHLCSIEYHQSKCGVGYKYHTWPYAAMTILGETCVRNSVPYRERRIVLPQFREV